MPERVSECGAWYARNGYLETARLREKGFERVYMQKALVSPRNAS